MNIKEHFKLKEGLSYISSNKVRIAGYKDKWNKRVFNALINKLNNHNIDNCLIKNEYTEG